MKNLAIFLLFIIVSSSISVELRKYQTLLRGTKTDPCNGKDDCSGGCELVDNVCVTTVAIQKNPKRTKDDCENKTKENCPSANCQLNSDDKCEKKPAEKKRDESCSDIKDSTKCKTSSLNCKFDNNVCVVNRKKRDDAVDCTKIDVSICADNSNCKVNVATDGCVNKSEKRDDAAAADTCANKEETACKNDSNCNFTALDGCKPKPQPQQKKREVTCSDYDGNQTDCETNNCKFDDNKCVSKVPKVSTANSKKRIDDDECKNRGANCTSDSQCVLDGDVCKKNPDLRKKDDVCTGKSKTDCPAVTCKYIVEENVGKCVVN